MPPKRWIHIRMAVANGSGESNEAVKENKSKKSPAQNISQIYPCVYVYVYIYGSVCPPPPVLIKDEYLPST